MNDVNPHVIRSIDIITILHIVFVLFHCFIIFIIVQISNANHKSVKNIIANHISFSIYLYLYF